MKLPDFCPWCGKILPENTPCQSSPSPSPLPPLPKATRWCIRTGIFVEHFVISCVAVAFFEEGIQLGGFWGGVAGLIIPSFVLALAVRIRW